MPERILSCMRSPCTWESLNGRWMAVRWKYLYSSSVGLHIVALIPIQQYFFLWFYFLQSKWNIESENLPDEVTNLGVFTIWLASSGCRPHTSSIWPWSGALKVHLYNTFLEGSRQIFMGHQISSCHVPVVRSFFILCKMLLSSWNVPYDHLLICTNITFQYPKNDLVLSHNSSCDVQISTSPVSKSHIVMSHN